jgi:tripartite-type tricarboxylate transporter receptor subunit TctC
MDLLRRKFLHLAAGAVTLPAISRVAKAQAYPTRPITIVDTFPPGGSTGILARILADRLSQGIGQQVIVDQRGGASGTIGARQVVKSAPDGYTLMLGFTSNLATGPSLYANAGYDPRKDFAPICLIGTAPNSLVAHPSLPAKSIPELIAYAKQNPGKVNFGSAGVASASHVAGEQSCRRGAICGDGINPTGARPLSRVWTGHGRSIGRAYSAGVCSYPGHI